MTRDEALARVARSRAWAEQLGLEKVTARAMLDEAERLEGWARSAEDEHSEREPPS